MRKICYGLITISLLSFTIGCSNNGIAVSESSNHRMLKKNQPKKSIFRVNPGKEEIFQSSIGTRLIIKKNSINLPKNYKKGEAITISLKEYISTIDIVSSGISMDYTDKEGKKYIFESAGMFSINASYKNKSLRLKKEKTISVKFPNIKPGDKYWVYFRSPKGTWVRHGHNQEITSGNERTKIIKSRLYEIDRFTLWNFDYANDRISCISGKVQSNNAAMPYQIVCAGIDYIGKSTRIYSTESFKMNILAEKKFKIFAFDKEGKIAVVNKIITAPEINNNREKNDKCYNIGTLIFKKVKKDIIDNPEKFLKVIGFTENKFMKNSKNNIALRNKETSNINDASNTLKALANDPQSTEKRLEILKKHFDYVSKLTQYNGLKITGAVLKFNPQTYTVLTINGRIITIKKNDIRHETPL